MSKRDKFSELPKQPRSFIGDFSRTLRKQRLQSDFQIHFIYLFQKKKLYFLEVVKCLRDGGEVDAANFARKPGDFGGFFGYSAAGAKSAKGATCMSQVHTQPGVQLDQFRSQD